MKRTARVERATSESSVVVELDLDEETRPGPLGGTVRRTILGHGAWIDLRPGWMAGADALLTIFNDAWGQLALAGCVVSVAVGYAGMLWTTRLPGEPRVLP